MSARIGPACLLAAMLALESLSCGRSSAVTASINERAALTGNLPLDPLHWSVITSSIDRRAATMSTLYGNDVAVQYARSNLQKVYPVGSVLSLVTWTQQQDPRWFGGKIPGPVKSVEFVKVMPGTNNQPSYSYEIYAGSPLIKMAASDGRPPESRAMYLLSLRAAVMP